MLPDAPLLRHLGKTAAAERLQAALADVIAEGRAVTRDLKPSRDDPTAATTTEVHDALWRA